MHSFDFPSSKLFATDLPFYHMFPQRECQEPFSTQITNQTVVSCSHTVQLRKAYSLSIQGFMLAPMAARLLTELILDGKSSMLELFSLERFRTGKLIGTTHRL
jgi:hypothetical protein